MTNTEKTKDAWTDRISESKSESSLMTNLILILVVSLQITSVVILSNPPSTNNINKITNTENLNPISIEEYNSAIIKRMQSKIDCLESRKVNKHDIEKSFPCVTAISRKTADLIWRYESWNKLHGKGES